MKNDKFRRASEEVLVHYFRPRVEQPSKSGKMAEFTKSKVFFIPFLKVEVILTIWREEEGPDTRAVPGF